MDEEMLRVEAARQARARNHPSYQDRRLDTLAGCLRVVGADLDQLAKPYYIVRVQPDGIQVQDRDGYEHSTDMETLKRRAILAVQMRQEAPVEASTPASDELDAVGAHTYALVVQPQAVRVKSPTGYDRSFDSDSLGRRAVLAPTCAASSRTAGSKPRAAPRL